jgi:hypothetical protein
MEIKNSIASLDSVEEKGYFLKCFIFKIYKNNIFIFKKLFLILIEQNNLKIFKNNNFK